MTQIIKRVPFDFDWPMYRVWSGYVNPYLKSRHECPGCKGKGLNPPSQQIYQDWLDQCINGYEQPTSETLTQEEVDLLFSLGHLEGYYAGKPTVEYVNRDLKEKAQWRDTSCTFLITRIKAARLGVWGYCGICQGTGELWESLLDQEKSLTWTPIEPPVGEGYQVWETVSPGSPVSPVLPDSNSLIRWYVESEGYSEEEATEVVENLQSRT